MYQQKYLKYKNKYLSLQKQIGGKKINLSGPVSIQYYENKSLNKKIIVLGDIHASKDGQCVESEGSIHIVKYLETLFEKPNIKIDLFIETSIPDKFSLINGLNKDKLIIKYIPDIISDIVNFGIKNYKVNPTKRIHFSDVRDELPGSEQFRSFSNLFPLLENIKEFKEPKNLFDFFYYFTSVFNQSLAAIIKDLRRNEFEYLPRISQYLTKEIKRSNPENLEKLKPVTYYYVRTYLDEIYNEKTTPDPYINLENLIELERINYNGIQAYASIADLYTVLRILKNDDINNSILFVGQAHCKILYDYLRSTGFTPIKSIDQKDELYRCMYDILDFEEFFLRAYL